jgi:hypothetical protein
MYYLNTFRPLVNKPQGRRAVLEYGLPPLIDGSIRKEPDFLNPRPSISALCRTSKFAPRLQPGDHIIYLTGKGKYFKNKPSSWHGVAVLEVIKRFDSHAEAAVWYKDEALPLPNNCMVSGNEHTPAEQCVQPQEKYTIAEWDGSYRLRSRRNPVFLACKPHFLNVEKTCPVHSEDIVSIFGRIPGTQNPPRIERAQFEALWQLMEQRVGT